MTYSMICDHEQHGTQFSRKQNAVTAAHIETQRTGVEHTHYLTTTWRDLEERLCWTVIPRLTAIKRLQEK